ncbi:putative nepenthesin [Dioscorea sansibarensis]
MRALCPCFNQPLTIPFYNPKRSSSFSKLPCKDTLCQASQTFQCTPDCEYKYDYTGGFSQGVRGTETMTFGGTEEISGVAFGCGNSNTFVVPNGSGIVGLGRGPLSLISQLSIKQFSYCLPSFANPLKVILYLVPKQP